ncbi:efflux RND transporter permease subunit [Thaumasiovibrio subtropicus]|uniref:efflux RND transporter permease subunit n=1 Tax=Thaumasiovibrio subtropicus TaxID=1891207 RepID=UPI000B354CEE|nr:efflux RND transporter permease subunit [Thaumasiovibrio subtropicus]
MNKILANSRLLILCIGMLLVSALGAIQALPRAEDPKLVNRWGSVSTYNPGSKPEHIEALITEPIELALRELDEIKLIESVSRTGISIINIELNETLSDTEAAWSKVRDKLNDIDGSLPAGTSKPDFDNSKSQAFTSITALKWAQDSPPDLLVLSRYADELANQLRNLPGTEYVEVYGAPEEEIMVEFDLEKAASLGLTADSISRLIQSSDTKTSAGELFNDSYRFQVEFSQSLDSVETVLNAPLLTLGSGHRVTVGDVAKVYRKAKTPDEQRALVDGEPAVVVASRMQSTLRVDLWTDRIHRKYTDFQAELPSNIKMVTLFEQNGYTTQRLTELLKNMGMGFALIVVVLLITLGLRSAFIVAMSLPLTSAFTLVLMNLFDIPINQMSVTGLIVALGIMVDNAIVMVDTIQEERKAGKGNLESALHAIHHLWIPLLGSTLTTILAFAPIFLMPGSAGEFVGAIAITVSFSLVGSYLISHTLVAGFAGRVIASKDIDPRWYHSGVHLPRLSNAFRRLVMKAVQYPILTVLLVSSVPGVGFWSISQLTEQFFPPSDRDMFQIQLHLPSNASIDATHLVVNQASEIIHEFEGIEGLNWVIGRDFPSFYYNLVGRHQGSANFAQAMVKTDTFNTANTLIPKLQVALDTRLPQAQALVRKLEQGPPFNAPIEIRVSGPNLDKIRSLSEEIRSVLATTPYVVHTRETMLPGVPTVNVDVNLHEGQINAMLQSDIARYLNASLSGVTGGYLIEATEQIPIRVRLSAQQRTGIESVDNIKFPTAEQGNGQFQPLSAIAQTELIPGIGAIPRRDGRRVNVIEGYLQANILPQTALDIFVERLAAKNITIPPGYTLELGGESAERNESVNQLMSNLFVVFTLLIGVVVLSFNSFRLSIIIFLVGGQAAGLGLLSVWLFNYPFGFTVIIGLLGLVGLAINAAIVIIAELRTRPLALQGDREEIVSSVMSCTRHITSTTITTVGGFLPLIIGGGGFWPPFAIAIAGGTVFTTLVSFFFVPAAFKLALFKRPLTMATSDVATQMNNTQ